MKEQVNLTDPETGTLKWEGKPEGFHKLESGNIVPRHEQDLKTTSLTQNDVLPVHYWTTVALIYDGGNHIPFDAASVAPKEDFSRVGPGSEQKTIDDRPSYSYNTH
ncbi:hypothetical protein WJ0W_002105 [Paenibacillus melissococcoides]|uniref:Uncharacterized protein n=1 Tax=Paenibacillus melissococcoides TaxID=2912268 RepID=A0ABN8U1C6_9BACL|nr:MULTISPECIES: hypothetical protein [Paenibacillus]MEB9895034.1 hypothetical protein [Bacillus cereus]CAH8244874.1 hypothetical protein WJ0W_002105 [Paenibacillus melissococcoides]CAH8709234.1 hypothetical protein WDD9_002187 [Paenibacillus melissococcoides]CAH8709990.1 hypothetical protein HTL2_002475 [Paenibacillus melissococcoides]GIO82480.1 hypothetical protein J6TS7_60900 [Paenibacillus dendritiformis]